MCKSIKISNSINHLPWIPSKSAQLMRNFLQPTASNMQDNFEVDSLEGPDPELLAGGMMEVSKTMDYDSDTSMIIQLITKKSRMRDGRMRGQQWMDQASKLMTLIKEMNLMVSHTENVTYLCSRIAKQPIIINNRSYRVH